MVHGYSTIGVYVDDSPQAQSRIALAAHYAVGCGAHLVGVAATGLPAYFHLGGLTGVAAAAAPAYLDQLKEQAYAALGRFARAAGRAGVQSFEKRVIEDDAGAALCLQARYSDLLVIGQHDLSDSLRGQTLTEYVMMNSACPVLIVPAEGTFTLDAPRVLLAWDGGMQAARTVHAAIPLLRQAAQVQVAIFDAEIGPQAHGEEPGADIALFLARHGVKVEVSLLSSAGDVGGALLAHTAYFGADLIVMGGYGHARFREVLLGGVTRAVLDAMTVPVLMSH
ncbi:universal stress protein [Noviherbaspirillum sp. UKPF54]|uniref:universal stress protein n=1 Tax=Noviherbaspirillum sp. UKPF54 TaxID=2601898 RepID=UPI0011B11DD5|nr:universal stress protein [Noviherbaspirillum sp. UKPF54]QDZ29944.1 universal stress protein [Noviherbaspirillum sp. UKPF54]